MKKWRWILLSGICILLLSACESRKTSGKGPDNTNSVNKLLRSQKQRKLRKLRRLQQKKYQKQLQRKD